MPVQTVIKLRRDTAANWDATNPVLAAGEMGIETDTSLHKFGDGTTAWGALQYSSSSRITQQVKNTTGSLVPKGSVVYISGATGGEALIALADADSEATSSKVIGLTTTAISNDALGMVIEQGLLVGVNTASATAGQSVWLSSTAGQFVFGAPPAKPAHSVYLGVVVRVHATEGEILVKVQNGYELNELHDVNAGSPSTGQVLQWNGSMWVNASVDALPSQSGENGKYLTTDGTTASWGTITIPPGTTVSDTAPSSPSVGQLWWESDTGILYIYYDGFWVEATAGIVGPQGDPGVIKSATAPTDTSVLWIDTTEAGEMVVPAGGTAGQALVKATSTNYDTTWAGPYALSPNYSINGGFDIFQRGTAGSLTLTSSAYAFDRWYAGMGGNVTYTQQSSGSPLGADCHARIAYNSNGAFSNLYQALEADEVNMLQGRTVTLSAKFRRNAGFAANLNFELQKNATANTLVGGTWSAIANTTITNASLPTGTGVNDWFTASMTVVVPDDNTANGLRIVIAETVTSSSGHYYEVAQVQLEIGSVVTPFRRTGGTFQGELAACQRYYWRSNFGSNVGAYAFIGGGRQLTTTTFDVMITNPVLMRTAASSIEFSSLQTTDTFNTGSSASGLTINSGQSSALITSIQGTNSGGTAGRSMYLINSNSSSGFVGVSAEL